MADSWICGTCGRDHNGIPLSFACDFPDAYANLSFEERDLRSVIGSDQCILDEKWFFIRGLIEIPIHGQDQPFLWGVWASIWQEAYDEISDSWDQPNREILHGPFKGRLANRIGYGLEPDAFNLELTVWLRSVGERPIFILNNTAHPLTMAQLQGISLETANAMAVAILHNELLPPLV